MNKSNKETNLIKKLLADQLDKKERKKLYYSNLIEDGKLNSDKLNPVIFLGDEHEKIYRYLRKLSDKAGKFYKSQFE